jgi:hypothetical protein
MLVPDDCRGRGDTTTGAQAGLTTNSVARPELQKAPREPKVGQPAQAAWAPKAELQIPRPAIF